MKREERNEKVLHAIRAWDPVRFHPERDGQFAAALVDALAPDDVGTKYLAAVAEVQGKMQLSIVDLGKAVSEMVDRIAVLERARREPAGNLADEDVEPEPERRFAVGDTVANRAGVVLGRVRGYLPVQGEVELDDGDIYSAEDLQKVDALAPEPAPVDPACGTEHYTGRLLRCIDSEGAPRLTAGEVYREVTGGSVIHSRVIADDGVASNYFATRFEEVESAPPPDARAQAAREGRKLREAFRAWIEEEGLHPDWFVADGEAEERTA